MPGIGGSVGTENDAKSSSYAVTDVDVLLVSLLNIVVEFSRAAVNDSPPAFSFTGGLPGAIPLKEANANPLAAFVKASIFLAAAAGS